MLAMMRSIIGRIVAVNSAASDSGGNATSNLAMSFQFVRGIFVPVEAASVWFTSSTLETWPRTKPNHSGVLGAHDENVRGANAVQWRDADFVKIWPQLAEQNFAALEFQLVASELGVGFPLGQCDAPARHVFKADVGHGRFDFVRLNAPARILGNFAKRSRAPAFRQLGGGGVHEFGFENGLRQCRQRFIHLPVQIHLIIQRADDPSNLELFCWRKIRN